MRSCFKLPLLRFNRFQCRNLSFLSKWSSPGLHFIIITLCILLNGLVTSYSLPHTEMGYILDIRCVFGLYPTILLDIVLKHTVYPLHICLYVFISPIKDKNKFIKGISLKSTSGTLNKALFKKSQKCSFFYSKREKK